jgi:hypothetical protein
MAKNLTEIKKRPLDIVLLGMKDKDAAVSAAAGSRLCNEASEYGLGLRDYLTLAVDVQASGGGCGENAKNHPFYLGEGQFMSGYEATLAELNLPFKNDFKQGVLLQAASDTFQYNPGSRALFPEVVDDMLQWQNKMDQFESTKGLVAQTRTISGPQLITRAIFDDKDDERHSGPVAEMSNIPVTTLTDSEHSVKFFKFGSAIRTSYEFSRRVTLDVLTPYAFRVDRQTELDKVAAATKLLVNGDAVFGAADVVTLGAYGADFTLSKTLKNNYVALMKLLVARARKGIPIDTLVGNLDMYLELFLMFEPTTSGVSVAEHLQKHGAPQVRLGLDLLKGVNFELSSSMTAGFLMAYSRGDTLEELTEANSQIQESEKAIRNQSVTYVKTINQGYRLIFGDTRTLIDCTQ